MLLPAPILKEVSVMVDLQWPLRLPTNPKAFKLPRWFPRLLETGTHLGAAEACSFASHSAGFLDFLTFPISFPWVLHLEVNGIGKLQKEKKKSPRCLWTYLLSGATLHQRMLLASWAAQQDSVQLASGSNGGRLEDSKEAAAWVFFALFCHQRTQHRLHPPWSWRVWLLKPWALSPYGVSHRSRLCSYRSLTRTRNKCEVCLAAPALHTPIAALVLNT